ncbi:GTP cyclohydrolase 1 type 2 [Rubripirellula lacrimiformis]|uniref:GTP cyclohydrolase 1 type 2 homolog n=1 Tax=Rubripirellula lacrimiformis TaxID=1930273 RepID=A0A517NIC1_9BACT|nr:Nif3-like dinuclear metal center hexameric protein [Rubripirellula lacrimiformis]QDT06885.1 GTP cyclohydrolase 1 type 2 [Rubripirellula lacrimiformis]
MNTTINHVCQTLAQIAPLRLAEDWDNVGLLIGDRKSSVGRVMTCLTVTPDVVDEAIEDRAGMIVAHHPLPFKPVAKITTDSVAGEMLWRLIGAGIAVYSAHTAFDSAAQGVNQMWAAGLGLQSIEPLVPSVSEAGQAISLAAGSSTALSESSDGSLGAGRLGRFAAATTLGQLARQATEMVQGQASSDSGGPSSTRLVGDPARAVTKVALACGSGGSFLAAAKRRGCDALVTGEATFHTCLEARSLGIGLVLLGHYQSERFAMERLAEQLAAEHAEVTVWASRSESDPVQSIG